MLAGIAGIVGTRLPVIGAHDGDSFGIRDAGIESSIAGGCWLYATLLDFHERPVNLRYYRSPIGNKKERNA